MTLDPRNLTMEPENACLEKEKNIYNPPISEFNVNFFRVYIEIYQAGIR